MSEEETGTGKGAAGEAQIQLSPGGSHLGGPLGGVLHNRLAEAVIHVGRHLPPVGSAGAAPHPRRPPPGPAQPLPPPCALRPPEANKPNRGGGSGGRAYGGGRGGFAGPRGPERGTGAQETRQESEAAGRGLAARGSGDPQSGGSLRALGGRELPFLLFFLAARPGEASRRARLPPGLARHASPDSTRGTVASPPGPGGPELFLGRYERQ